MQPTVAGLCVGGLRHHSVMQWSDAQPLATSLASIGAFGVLLFSVWKERHPLRLIERLTEIERDIENTETRRLVQDYRDERVTAWVLIRRAPRESTLRGWAVLLRILGAFTLCLWLLLMAIFDQQLWTWWIYAVGLVLIGTATALEVIRGNKRGAWMHQERAWRDLPEPASAQAVPTRS